MIKTWFKTTNKLWILMLSLFSFLIVLNGNFVHAETINEALSSAYQNNPQLLAEQARLRATDEGLAQAQSSFRPNISLNAEVGSQKTDTRPGALSDGRSSPYGYSVTLNQPLFRGFRTVNGVRAAKADISAGRAALRNTEQLVLRDAVTVYMNVVRDKAIVQLRQNNLRVLTKQYDGTFERFSVGEVTQTDLSQAKARRSRAVSDLSLAKANYNTSLAEYQRVIGKRPGRVGRPSSIVKYLPHSQSKASIIGLNEHPQLEAAYAIEKSARYNLDVIKGERLPEVNLEMQYGQNFDQSPSTDRRDTGTVFARARVPLYQSGALYSRIRQAKQIVLQRRAEIQQTRLQVRASIISAWGQMIAVRAQIQANKVAVRANRKALSGVKDEEKVGQRTILDVLDAEQELLNSLVTLVTSERDLVVAEYNLLAAIGRLSVSTLPITNIIYDVEENYRYVNRRWRGGDINAPELDSRSLLNWGDIFIMRH